MDIKQLEAFVSVADTGSFSIAAKQLCLTQPTVSVHISGLESELGAKLFDRLPGESVLTETGKTLYSYARKIIVLRGQAIEACAEKSMNTCGSISIAASTIPYQYVLPVVTSEFRIKYPDVQFKLSGGDSSAVVSAVMSGASDLGFVGAVIENTELTYIRFMEDTLVVITPALPPYDKEQNSVFPFEQLQNSPFILRSTGSGTRLETQNYLEKRGLSMDSLNIAAEMDNSDAVNRAVSQGLGISIVSRLSAIDYERFGQIRVFNLEETPISRTIYLVKHKKRPLPPHAERFERFIINR